MWIVLIRIKRSFRRKLFLHERHERHVYLYRPQIWKFCLLMYRFVQKWISSLKMIFLLKLGSDRVSILIKYFYYLHVLLHSIHPRRFGKIDWINDNKFDKICFNKMAVINCQSLKVHIVWRAKVIDLKQIKVLSL